MRPYFKNGGPLAFAHRGGAKVWPENTLKAFEGAIALGYRFIETDVHMTTDGHFVCLHDPTLERTTDGYGFVKDLSLSELQRFDAGYNFKDQEGKHAFRGGGCTVPTLQDALAIHDDVHFNVELKHKSPEAVRRLWEFIEHHGIHDRVLIAAEDDSIGDAFHKYNKGRIATSPGAKSILTFWAKVRLRLAKRSSFRFDALQVPTAHRGLQVVTPSFIDAAHNHGIQVHVWTIDDPTQMHALLNQGVDGLMTDFPAVLLEAIDTHPR